jgi:Mg2+/Co2+ transporter CorC
MAAIGDGFDVGTSADEVDTLGGLLVTLASRVPIRNEILRGPGDFDFEIIDADPRRVKRVRIFRRPPEPPKRERKRKPKAPAESSAIQPTEPESNTPPNMDNRNASG